MNKLKRYTITGIIFVVITGIISHFIYEWSGKSFLLGLFFPVNESTWEHMKLSFFPMLLYSVYTDKKIGHDYPCAAPAFLFGSLLGSFFIPVIFYTYSGILGQNYLALDIATFILSILIAFTAAYQLTLSCRLKPYTKALKLIVVITAVCFFIFTYYPPSLGVFIDPTG